MTGRIPAYLVMVAGSFVDDTVFCIAHGAGIPNDIPGSRAGYFWFCGGIFHYSIRSWYSLWLTDLVSKGDPVHHTGGVMKDRGR